ncbi:MAG TPA: argininosuccinate lyase [Ktedonobacterales bacterium]|nr:argininosuccinate lyase [Ktedonobacterales bacterium]
MTTTTLWSKGGAHDPAIARYEAGRNAALDALLARHDLWGSLAHARMLHAIGWLDDGEWQVLSAALRALLAEAEAGTFALAPDEEDIHSAIEHQLVARVGPSGSKVHLGRSRNDQVLLALRLYAREALPAIALAALDAAAALARLAARHEWTPLPGYTHMQRAMLSSVGLWAAAHAEALLDDCMPLAAAYALSDQLPLGSAAAYGVPLPLDRELVARLLGFARVHTNVLTAANARGKIEAATVQALALVMLDLSKLAQDVLLFTTSEFAFFQAPAELCDGSSIMPQKRNLSALELVRARAQTVIALQGQMLATLAGLPSGYNMDYQETKAPFLEALALCRESLEVARLFAAGIEPLPERMAAACTPDLFATDAAYDLARAGTPFREAYQAIAQGAGGEAGGDLAQRLRARASTGAPGNLGLAALDQRIADERAAWERRRAHLAGALRQLVSGKPETPAPAATPLPSSPSAAAAPHHPDRPFVAPGI